jgi:hypothetical protein
MSHGMKAILFLLCVISILHVLRFSLDQSPECAEVRAWVYDEESGRCLVRLKRTRVSMEVIVSGKSITELQTRAQCTMHGWAPAIESGCWKQRGGFISQWIERGF